MKVLVVSHSAVVDVNQQLYVELARLPDTEVELVVPAEWPSEYGPERLRPRLLPEVKFPVHALPVVMGGKIPLHFYRSGLGRVLNTFRPDVVYAHEEPYGLAAGQLTALCKARRIPLALYSNQNLLKRYPPPFAQLERFIQGNTAAILALSPEVRQVLQDKGYAGPTPILDYAVDLRMFTPRSPDQADTEVRARLGLPAAGEAPVVGYLGRITAAKGVDTLVQALTQLRDENWSALIVGSGPEEAPLREAARAAGLESRIRFAGAVPHDAAADYVRLMDLAVVPSRTTPSWKEQFGRVIIEAMACGIPVVGSNSGQIPHLIRETGGGAVFPEGDAAALAAALQPLLRSAAERSRLGTAGQEVVRRRYTYQAVAAALSQALREVAGGARSVRAGSLDPLTEPTSTGTAP